jgi:hypothetical protein
MNRRTFLSAPVLLLGAGRAHAAAPVVVEVFKGSACGCCTEWMKHLEQNGFAVRAVDVPDPGQYRRRFGLPDRYASCHTARVGGYVVEGHVPAREIRRLLAERRAAVGLAVPGMPIGSPGMEQGARVMPYEVLLVAAGGQSTVYAQYGK